MCRLIAYLGEPLLAADLVTRPSRSIIRQSFDARQRLGGTGGEVYHVGALNADGFGLGWYVLEDDEEDMSPCLLTDTGPAWNNRNLIRLARKIRSRIFFAHVRAAGPGMGVCQCSCHPFEYGRYMFMHNGQVGEFGLIRRPLLQMLNDDAFNLAIRGSCTDSALAFALFVNMLQDPFEQLSPSDLQRKLLAVVDIICTECERAGSNAVSLLNFVITDGLSMVATRFIRAPLATTSPAAASLYFASGTAFEPDAHDDDEEEDSPEEEIGAASGKQSGSEETVSEYRMVHGDRRDQVVMIASEPLTDVDADWVAVPNNHCVLVTRSKQVFLTPVEIASSTSVEQRPLAADVYRVLETLGHAHMQPPNKRSLMHRMSNLSFRSLTKKAPHEEEPVLGCCGGGTGGPSVTRDEFFRQVSSSDGQSVRAKGVPTKRLSLMSSVSQRRYNSAEPTLSSDVEVEPLQVLQGRHGDAVLSMVVHGRFLISSDGARRGKICVWDTSTWACVAQSNEQTGSVLVLCLNVSSNVLLSVCSDNTVTAWCLDHLSQTCALKELTRWAIPPVGHVLCMLYESDTVVFGCQDANVRKCTLQLVCDEEEADAVGRARGPVARVSSDSLVVTPAAPSSVRFCSLIPMAKQGQVNGGTENEESSSVFPCFAKEVAVGLASSHCGYVYCVSSVDDYWCTGAGDGLVKMWRKSDSKVAFTLTGHRGAVFALAANDNSVNDHTAGVTNAVHSLLFSASADCTVKVWDLVTRSCRHTMLCSAEVLSLALSPQTICAGTSDGTIYTWTRTNYARLREYDVGYQPVHSLVINHKQSFLACGCGLGNVHIWSHDDYGTTAKEQTRHPNTKALFDDLFPVITTKDAIPESPRGDEEPDRSKLDQLDDTDQAMINSLRRFVAFPSVSADPSMHESCWNAAQFVANMMEHMGCQVKYCADTNRQRSKHGSPTSAVDSLPVLLGRIEANASGDGEQQDPKTVVFYAHYDVVHAQDEDWSTNPWKVEGKDGFLYGRGTTDDKGPLMAIMYAVASLHNAGELSCNVVFIVEGEEESGYGLHGRGFDRIIKENLDFFQGADAVVISNNYWINNETPCLTYAMRGVIDFEVSVSGPKMDLHAGVDGGPIFEPVADLVAILSELTAQSVVGPVPELGADEAEIFDKINFSVDEYAKRVGVNNLKSSCSKQVLASRWAQPTLSVSSIKTTNKAHSFRKIPCIVTSRVSVHFVPGQSGKELSAEIERRVRQAFAKRNSPNQLHFSVKQESQWWLGKPDNHVFKVAKDALKKVWNVDPLLVREGGSYGGITAFLETTLDAAALHLPMGQASDNAHLPNERIRIHNLVQGRRVVEEFLRMF